MNFSENINQISERLSKMQAPSGVVEILAVTKTFPVSAIEEAVQVSKAAGKKLLHFGENRVQEAEEKIPLLRQKFPELMWHLIGHLQSNKAKKAVSLFDSIDSVDSLELAREIDRRAGEIGKIMPVMIEINIGGEQQKFGVKPDEAFALVEQFIGKKGEAGLKNLKLTGIMSVLPVVDNPEKARPYFRKLKEIYLEINRQISPLTLQYLSMGMSDDWKVAVEEGSSMIRLGRALFGNR